MSPPSTGCAGNRAAVFNYVINCVILLGMARAYARALFWFGEARAHARACAREWSGMRNGYLFPHPSLSEIRTAYKFH